MDDSFCVRVDKVFGSLSAATEAASSLSTAALSSSFWCLTDEEIERRGWNRNRDLPEDDTPRPYPSNLDGFFANQYVDSNSCKEINSSVLLQELNDDLEEEEDDDDDDDDEMKREQLVKPDYLDQEAWDIRSSIGLDSTLDGEEEEDAFDKVATSRDDIDDNLYVRDITDYEEDINFYDELPNTFKDASRDPRANHVAAKLRLKEDAEIAGNFYNLQVSYDTIAKNNKLEENVGTKSILKRRETQTDLNSRKHLSFRSGCKDDCEEGSEGTKILVIETSSPEEAQAYGEAFSLSQESSGIPEYLRNPSKYKHYTFDSSSDMDEASNRRAYMDFLNLMKGSNAMEAQDGISIELPKSVTFTPKKKRGSSTSENNRVEFKQNREDNSREYMHHKGFPIGIAAGDAQEGGVCSMEEDDVPIPVAYRSISSRPGRQYRRKAGDDSVDLYP